MGYHSEVAIELPKKHYDAFIELLKNEAPDAVEDFISNTFENKNDRLIHFESIKWDDYYKEVALWRKFKKMIDYDEYKFIELGENDNDSQSEGGYNGNFRICINRHICFNNQ